VPSPRVSPTILHLRTLAEPVFRFFETSARRVEAAGAEACDFTAGNPQEPEVAGYSDALRRWSAPERRDWYAYKVSEPESRRVAAAALRERLGIPFEADDVLMTNAAIAGLAVALRAVVDTGDEVVIVSPPHFIYEPLVVVAGGAVARVRVQPGTFDLDVDALAAALGPRTRAVILNTPHNPTGRIFPPATLRDLAAALTEASERWGPVYLLSDEAYHRILFDGRSFTSPAAFYPDTMVIYSYGKQLLAPGQRIGFVALPPTMAGRQEVRAALLTAQLVTGWAFPNALLQHALVDLDGLSVDMGGLQEKRDRMVEALRAAGYELHVPEATFYLLVRSPLADDREFCEVLARENVFVMPGAMLEMPGYFRISLTATEDMIGRSVPGFERAMKAVRA
jgi:aspartate aminotransferase